MTNTQKLPPTILIKATDFSAAWARLVRHVLRDGVKAVIGDHEDPKPVLDTCSVVELTGGAIRQIENQEIHSDYPFKHIGQYCEEFTRDYLSQYIDSTMSERFSYLYFERLAMYNTGHYSPSIDQLTKIRDNLVSQVHTNVTSNRCQAITWQVSDDILSDSPPCLQRIQVRYLGNSAVAVHFNWRSRDCFTAWQANIIALVSMLNREVIRPNKCHIAKIVDYSDSLHIYQSDVAAAANVKLVPTLL